MSRARGPVETLEYGAMVGRMIRAWTRRVGEADEPELAQMLAARNELDAAILHTIYIWRTQLGRSWEYIAQATGHDRTAAYQRWDRPVKDMARERGELHLLPMKGHNGAQRQTQEAGR